MFTGIAGKVLESVDEYPISWRNVPKSSSLSWQFFVLLGVRVLAVSERQRAAETRVAGTLRDCSMAGHMLEDRKTGRSVNILLGKLRKPVNSAMQGSPFPLGDTRCPLRQISFRQKLCLVPELFICISNIHH